MWHLRFTPPPPLFLQRYHSTLVSLTFLARISNQAAYSASLPPTLDSGPPVSHFSASVDFRPLSSMILQVLISRGFQSTSPGARFKRDPSLGFDFVNRRKLRRDPSLRFVARGDHPGRMVTFGENRQSRDAARRFMHARNFRRSCARNLIRGRPANSSEAGVYLFYRERQPARNVLRRNDRGTSWYAACCACENVR